MVDASPTVAAWELMLRIKRQAAERGIKPAEIQRGLGVGAAYWSQVTNYKGILTEDKLNRLIDLLEFEADERQELLDLRAVAKGRSLYAQFSALLDDELMRFYNLEAGASSIRSFENSVIPGLLQTENYMRTLIKARVVTARPTEAEPRVQIRLLRQRRLAGEDAPKLAVVVGEASLRYQVGDTNVHREQLEHLRTLIEQRPGHLDFRVIPFASGTAIASLNAATFHLLGFPSPRLPIIGWMETAIRGEVTEEPRDVDGLVYQFEQIHSSALDQSESLDVVNEIARQIG
ncbi:DUF5753 domain-containing protein [Nocardia terpenica]|nr:DUF5753 domain-containing protein [Nocardia terpenica]NQE88686.1 transcriptional regulator [Nocardia terpenica]